jgi:hypothetical protein
MKISIVTPSYNQAAKSSSTTRRISPGGVAKNMPANMMPSTKVFPKLPARSWGG